MIEQTIDISTKDGATTTFIVHPDRGGPHPLIIFYMDAPAIREELRDMARRLASAGYYVMLPNLYYRAGVLELGPLSPDPSDPGRARMAPRSALRAARRGRARRDRRRAVAAAVPARPPAHARAGAVGLFRLCGLDGAVRTRGASRHAPRRRALR